MQLHCPSLLSPQYDAGPDSKLPFSSASSVFVSLVPGMLTLSESFLCR
uniref:Uncharacterized protein n=1 Tax=Ciona intestinalis TaxID=7719 RepID=H2XV17_CIOIN